MDFIKKNQFKIAAITISLLLICIVALFVFPKNGNKNDNVYYSVTFDSDGGSEVNTQFVLEGGKTNEPISPIRDGYTFLGWYIGDRKFDFDNMIYQNIKLEAKWENNLGGDMMEDNEEQEDGNDDNKTDSSQIDNPSDNNENMNKPTTSDKVNITGITLNKINLTLNVGDSSTLVVTIKPDNATNKNVTWSSSNKSVVTVSNGVVKAVGEGSAIVTASAGGKNIKCNVTVNKVKDDSVVVTDIILNKISLNLEIGESDTLVATVKPDNATNKDVTWSSSNKSIVTVSNGVVKAVGEGSAIVTASADGKEIKCTVTVNKKITYNYKWERIESSSLGEYYLYIVSSEGKNVNGKVNIIYSNNKNKEWDVTTGGLKVIKGTVSSVEIISIK